MGNEGGEGAEGGDRQVGGAALYRNNQRPASHQLFGSLGPPTALAQAACARVRTARTVQTEAFKSAITYDCTHTNLGFRILINFALQSYVIADLGWGYYPSLTMLISFLPSFDYTHESGASAGFTLLELPLAAGLGYKDPQPKSAMTAERN